MWAHFDENRVRFRYISKDGCGLGDIRLNDELFQLMRLSKCLVINICLLKKRLKSVRVRYEKFNSHIKVRDGRYDDGHSSNILYIKGGL